MTLIEKSAVELLSGLESGDWTSVELTGEFLDRIDAVNESVGALVLVQRDEALLQAEKIDTARREGKPRGRLAGLPVALKDLLCTEGVPTTCCSRMLDGWLPPYDATVVSNLRDADAVFIGRANMDEFAMGGSNETSAAGVCRNPWDTERIPGGSSGGSAAVVAASMAPLAVGSDTGGSIRAPAALCGVTGLKPTYGRVSRYGLVAFASSLDQIGPIARDAWDTALLMEVLAGHDTKDSTSLDRPVPLYSESIDQPLAGLRIGIVPEHFGDGLDADVGAAVQAAIDVYKSLGATVKEISLPHSKYAVATYYIIAPCEASSNLSRYDSAHYGHRTDVKQVAVALEAERKELQESGKESAIEDMDSGLVRTYRQSRSEGFGDEVKRRIMLGTYALSAGYYDAYYKKAAQVRHLIRQDYDRAFEEVDLIAGPVTPSPAYRIGEKADDPLSMYLFDLYTTSTNLAGICGISVPCGLSDSGLPIGLHLQAPPLEEERLLRGAAMYQRETDWHLKRPSM